MRNFFIPLSHFYIAKGSLIGFVVAAGTKSCYNYIALLGQQGGFLIEQQSKVLVYFLKSCTFSCQIKYSSIVIGSVGLEFVVVKRSPLDGGIGFVCNCSNTAVFFTFITYVVGWLRSQ